MKKEKPLRKRKGFIILGIVIAFLLLAVLAVYIVIQSYINKINIVPDEEILIVTPSPTEEFGIGIDDGSVDQPGNGGDTTQESAAPTEDSPAEEIQSVEDQIRSNLEDSSEELVYSEDVYNILLIGSDTRVPGQRARSDVNIIVSINKKTSEIVMTSILRDTYLHIPGVGNDRINAAYAYGGAPLLLETIYQNFKIKIDKYIYVEFLEFIDIMDAIGPIELTIEDSYVKTLNFYLKEINSWRGDPEGSDYFEGGGVYECNGKQVLAYVRNRYTRNGDFDRTSRQREVLQIVYDKLKTMNLVQLKKVLDVALPAVTTNLDQGEIFSLMLAMPQYAGYDLVTLSVPASGTFSYLSISGKSVLGINFDQNKSILKEEIYGS